MRPRRTALDASAAGLVPLHPTHYERLRVAENASPAAIKAAWQACLAEQPALRATAQPQPVPSLVLPGVPDSPALAQAALRLAHAVLSNPARRAVYDAWLARERQAAELAAGRQRWWRRPRVVVALVLAALGGALTWWFMSGS